MSYNTKLFVITWYPIVSVYSQQIGLLQQNYYSHVFLRHQWHTASKPIATRHDLQWFSYLYRWATEIQILTDLQEVN